MIKSNRMTAVAYVRRSTTGQEESFSIQREKLKRYAEAHGYKIGQWFEDDGLSGDDENRPGFLSMIDAAKRGGFEYILVVDLSTLR